MAGTLSSLNTALTALRFNRVAMDVAANNIANATTEGYARRRVGGEAIGAPAQPAMWSRYDGVGRILYACQRAGITKVAFITEPPPLGN